MEKDRSSLPSAWSGLAADKRARLAFQRVGQDAQAPGRPGEFIQRIAEILLRGSVRFEQSRVGIVRRELNRDERAVQIFHGGFEAGHELRVTVTDELLRALQRLLERLQILPEIVADRFERHPVDLVDDAPELGLELGQRTGNHGELRLLLAEVDLRLGRISVVVERDVKLPGQETPASQLTAQTPLLDEASHEGPALLLVLQCVGEIARLRLYAR